MKKISVVIPCYNDSNSVAQMHQRLTAVFNEKLPNYDYEMIFVDDCSPDNTWDEIKKVCASDKRAKGVHNMKNFGYCRNVFSAMQYGDGDATFMLVGDLQDPPEALPEFVTHWEQGHEVVIGVRANSYDKLILRILRRIYYHIIHKISKGQQIEGASGFGLYGKRFVSVLAEIDDIQPVITGILTEYAPNVKKVPVRQEKGGREKSNWNFWSKYDMAMASITSYTKTLLRISTFVGIVVGILSILYAMFICGYKILFWDTFAFGIPSLAVGMFSLGAIQLVFLGIIGEYILSINNRSMKRPLVIVDQKINFSEGDK